MWTLPSLESIGQDVRYAVRSLVRSPGFTSVALLSLAIGIGGNTAVFSLVDSVRTQALPYREPQRLVTLWGNVQRERVERRGNSYPDFLDWQARATSYDGLAAIENGFVTLDAGGESERLRRQGVSASFFPLLGVSAAIGRTFDAGEDSVAERKAVAVLSDGLWRRRFGADPQILGRRIMLNAQPFEVVGVLPPDFKGIEETDLWTPFVALQSPAGLASRGSRGFPALGRLRTGVSLAQAQAEIDAISRQLELAYPETNEKRGVDVIPFDVEVFGSIRPAILTLMGAVIFVLLIACANVGNLLVARSERRQREMAIRTALGAARGRLLRQLITESLVLTSIGGAAGLLVAHFTFRALVAASPIALPGVADPHIDPRAAAFTAGVMLACGMLLGLAPATHARVSRLAEALKDSARGSDGRRSHRVRGGLVVAEVGLAVVLLVGAALMIRSVRNLLALDPGFNADRVLTLRISIPRANVGTPAAAATPAAPPPPLAVDGRAIAERVRALPGVTQVSLTADVPLDGSSSAQFYSAEGQPAVTAQNVPRTYVHRVTPDFFATLRIPLLSGRPFTEQDASPASTAVVVSERVVKRFWPGQDPIGKRIKMGQLSSNAPWLSIVGVVGDVKYRGLPENPTADPDMYFPFLDRNQQLSLAVRTNVPPETLTAPIRAAIRELNSSIPVYNVATMAELVGRQTARSRFTMWLMGVFAATALLLSVVGIYGVMSYLVSERKREIGIRIALGAQAAEILRLIVGHGARLIAAGIVIGAVVSIALQRLIAGLLFGVGSTDVSAGLAVALLAAVALFACYVPAWRATRVDPLSALRHE
jgi:putative ABC transport system permease protein